MLRLPVLGALESVDAVVLCALLLWGSASDYWRHFERIYDRMSRFAPPPQAIFDFEGTVTQFGFCLSTLSGESAEEVMGWLRGLADMPMRPDAGRFGLRDVGFTDADLKCLEGRVGWTRELALLLVDFVFTRPGTLNHHLLFPCTLSPEPSEQLLWLYERLLLPVGLFICPPDSLKYTASSTAIHGVPPDCRLSAPRRNRRGMFETKIFQGEFLMSTWDISTAGLVIANVESSPKGISFKPTPGNVRPLDTEAVRKVSQEEKAAHHAAAVRLFAALGLAVRARCLLKRVSTARLTGMTFEHCQVRRPEPNSMRRRDRSDED
jgi:hypothetical protein